MFGSLQFSYECVEYVDNGSDSSSEAENSMCIYIYI